MVFPLVELSSRGRGTRASRLKTATCVADERSPDSVPSTTAPKGTVDEFFRQGGADGSTRRGLSGDEGPWGNTGAVAGDAPGRLRGEGRRRPLGTTTRRDVHACRAARRVQQSQTVVPRRRTELHLPGPQHIGHGQRPVVP